MESNSYQKEKQILLKKKRKTIHNIDVLMISKTIDKEKTSEEKFRTVKISEKESQNIMRVFQILVNDLDQQISEKRQQGELGIQSFGQENVRKILKKLGVTSFREQDIDIMIWEVDEDLNGRVDKKEFTLMYKKCIEDKSGLEARNLFNLVQFLMFCK